MGSSSSSMVFLNSSLSSDSAIAFVLVPSISTPSLSSAPLSESSEHRFRAVCPPMPASMPWTRSFSSTFSSVSASSGSMYTLSAVSVSVCIVAGLEFTSTVV